MTAYQDGQLGLVSNLRGYSDWRDQSNSEKRLIMELAPAAVLSGWVVFSGSTYVVTPPVTTLDMVTLPVTSVRAGDDPRPLVRAESAADCVATPGSFFLEEIHPDTGARWDDGVTLYDTAATTGPWWDLNQLYAHLWSESSPNDTTVAAEYLLVIASAGMVVPDLGPEKARNASFESWTAGSPDSWTAAVANALTTVNQDTTNAAVSGVTSVRITSATAAYGEWDDGSSVYDAATPLWDSAQNPYGELVQTHILRSGAIYAVTGYYKTDAGAAALLPYVRVGVPGSGQFIASDGFSSNGSWMALPATQGEWRRFYLEFLSWTTSDTGELALRGWNGGGGGGASGNVWFDDVTFRRVHRRLYAEPRVAKNSSPQVSMSSRDITFGGKTVASAGFSFINLDDRYNQIAASLDWVGHEVRTYVGGLLGDGTALPRQDYRQEYTGSIRRLEVGIGGVKVDVRDIRDKLNVELPSRIYATTEFSQLADGYDGSSRPLFFGSRTGISGIPLTTDANGYRTYEICDTDGSPAGIVAVSAVYAYESDQAADDRDTAARVALTLGTDYSVDLSLARVAILNDCRVIRILPEANKLDFNDGSVRVATLTPGVYTPRLLVAHAQTRMRAVGAADLNCTYNESTHLPAFSKGAGSLSLLINTGANANNSAWDLFGFTESADKTGSLSYAADTAIFTDADSEHVVRIDATGLKDDASGTYTGTAGGTIQKGADIVRYIVSVLLRRPDAIDGASFASARSSAPQNLAIYLKQPTNLRDVLDRIEWSCGADVVVDGDGLFYFTVADATVPPNVVDLMERDFLSDPAIAYEDSDLYQTVKVTFDEDPTTGEVRTRSATNSGHPVRYQVTKPKTFDTFLTSDSDAIARAAAMADLCSFARRTAQVDVKGKLGGARIGSKYRVTHSRAADPTGALSAVLFRVLSVTKRPIDGRATATLVEV